MENRLSALKGALHLLHNGVEDWSRGRSTVQVCGNGVEDWSRVCSTVQVCGSEAGSWSKGCSMLRVAGNEVWRLRNHSDGSCPISWSVVD